MLRSVYVMLAAVPLVAGCNGKSAGRGSSGDVPLVVMPAPTPSASPSPTPTPSPSPTAAPPASGFAAQAAALYDVAPDPAACRAGTLKAAVKADVLTKLNAIRALHRLPAVSYSEVENDEQAAAALMMAVNRALSHTPPTGWTCYAAAGATAAGASNLIGGWGNGLAFQSEDDLLAGWLTEGGSAAIGHRRWLLSPFLGKVSYGRVSYATAAGDRATAAALRVFGFAGAAGVPASVPGFVAYPYGSYPARYFRATDYLSFTAVANVGGPFGANSSVGFAGATISVTGPAGALAVSDVAFDNAGYGVGNAVRWRVAGLQPGVTYTVRISGVTGTSQSEYGYTFSIG